MGLGLFRSAKRKKKSKSKVKQTLQTSFAKMLKKFGGDPQEKVDRSFKPLSVDPLLKVLKANSDRCVSHLPSVAYRGVETARHAPRYVGKMAEREAVANCESERRKKMVAPLYNKGPAAYIAGYDPKDLGKKT